MRKAFSILIGIHYFVLTVGIAISVHYCQGEVESVNITSESSCCCGVMENMADCCSDTEFQLQLDIDQFFSSSPKIQFENTFIDFPVIDKNSIQTIEFESQKEFAFVDIPPPIKQPSWLLNCELTYYG